MFSFTRGVVRGFAIGAFAGAVMGRLTEELVQLYFPHLQPWGGIVAMALGVAAIVLIAQYAARRR